MSSSRSNAATWMPISVFHVDFGLTPEHSVALVNVSGLIVNCWYVKISSGFLYWVLEQFLPVIPAEMTLDSMRRVRARHDLTEKMQVKRCRWSFIRGFTHPKPLLQRGCWPSLSRASLIPTWLLPNPSPSFQPCFSITRRPNPFKTNQREVVKIKTKITIMKNYLRVT